MVGVSTKQEISVRICQELVGLSAEFPSKRWKRPLQSAIAFLFQLIHQYPPKSTLPFLQSIHTRNTPFDSDSHFLRSSLHYNSITSVIIFLKFIYPFIHPKSTKHFLVIRMNQFSSFLYNLVTVFFRNFILWIWIIWDVVSWLGGVP